MKKLTILNKEREFFQHRSGDSVYIILPLTSQLRISCRKISVKYEGTLVVYNITDHKSFLLHRLNGKLLQGLMASHGRVYAW